jgi:hypothetical protein
MTLNTRVCPGSTPSGIARLRGQVRRDRVGVEVRVGRGHRAVGAVDALVRDVRDVLDVVGGGDGFCGGVGAGGDDEPRDEGDDRTAVRSDHGPAPDRRGAAAGLACGAAGGCCARRRRWPPPSSVRTGHFAIGTAISSPAGHRAFLGSDEAVYGHARGPTPPRVGPLRLAARGRRESLAQEAVGGGLRRQRHTGRGERALERCGRAQPAVLTGALRGRGAVRGEVDDVETAGRCRWRRCRSRCRHR